MTENRRKKGAEYPVEKQHRYMVKRDGQLPTLLRIESDGKREVYRSGNSEYSDQFYWIYTPELADIADQKERFPEYADISDEEAEEIKHQLEKEYARIDEEKHVIHIEHTQKTTDKGIVYINTYTKGEERPRFRSGELEKLFSELTDKEHVVIQEINYDFYDYWGYPKHRTSMRKEDIPEICGESQSIYGSFTDQEMKYIFTYKEADNRVVVAKCLKKSGIDLWNIFSDEKNG